ncbi:hypothetical protein [Polynucleobacter sp. Tro8-14-1]|uniref:Uncharacterized protein n=2 Tax=Polynucleobacter sphagniphilus TaxID=1743169 RepID=A0AA43MB27_9BURK|nr:hypothetical protein [Polynucleobacter sp. Tro8-14-1]MBU3562835.1 hypothetical protein [Polynucleobacter sp. Tro8-14-1]MDH6504037.1 hypothetical protein [Polynucleobacter sphagniphilus]MDH6512529.1 hypothetical protein [Polynucleobacter sphagniphilus]
MSMKKIFIGCLFLLFSNAFAGNLYMGSVLQGTANGQTQAAQVNMMNAWTQCMNNGGGATCGNAPQASQPSPTPQYNQVPQRDYQCFNDCMSHNYTSQLCSARCSY